MWHAEITELTLREVVSLEDYANRVPFGAVATVNLLGGGRAFVRAALRRDGRPLSVRDWRALAIKLREEFGVSVIEADRHGRIVSWRTDRVEGGGAV